MRRACKSVMSLYRSLALCSFLILVAIYLCGFVLPVRNALLGRVLKKAWMNVNTLDLLHMHFTKTSYPPELLDNVSCDAMQTPSLRRKDVDASGILVYNATHNTSLVHKALSRGHGHYLPVLTRDQKLDYLYLFRVMREALERRNIRFFMTAGTILGAMRHGGFIPWDDDLDVGISVEHGRDVTQELGCIRGFKFFMSAPHHWKFKFEDRGFPFIDIFYYSRHKDYLWALAQYISHTFIYPVDMVFPLVKVDFEGTKMPMPGRALHIAWMIYDFSQCRVNENHIDITKLWTDRYSNGYSTRLTACRDLSYMYTMSNLDGD